MFTVYKGYADIPDKDDPGKDFMLMEELIRFLDDIMVDDILS